VLPLIQNATGMDGCHEGNSLQQDVEKPVIALMEYCRKNDWAGYDPYDALNSRLFVATPLHRSRICRLILTQALKRLPIDLRPILQVPKTQNPKAIALFLAAFLKLSALGFPDARSLVDVMVERLTALRSPGIPYWCWGYSFAWQTRTIIVPRGAPNLVCTVFAADALIDAYEKDPQPRYLEMAASAAEYILDELYWTDGDGTASFSYPLPGLRTMTYNANFLAAALFCRIQKHYGGTKFLEPALKAARSSVARQHEDGSWNYGEASTQRWADNFHTGYNLCALQSIARNAGTSEFEGPIRRGFEFYRAHFFREDGAPRYFHDRTYPIDVHSVAQSVITLLTFSDVDEGNLQLALDVYRWAIDHLWDDKGYFYYRILRLGKNKISYLRGSQAWMLLAMSVLLEHATKSETSVVP
jgi:hypothetical protein